MTESVRLGTRSSALARAQSQWVADALYRIDPAVTVTLVPMVSEGDRITDRPLHEFGGKGLFTRTIEQALLDGRIDMAVHSYKDLPVTEPLLDTANLVVAAIPQRADPRDALVSMAGWTIDQLPQNARVGTSSLRRKAQLLDRRTDLQATDLRGNVDTRLRKLAEGQYDAIVLAVAGLQRVGLWNPAMMRALDAGQMVPAAGQGALAIQCRAADRGLRDWLARLDDPITSACVRLERAVVAALGGDCHSSIGALAEHAGGTTTLRAMLGARPGEPARVVRATVAGLSEDELVRHVLQLLQPGS